ncbi:hypothetical protein [Rhizobium rhizosphaerae]|uniref:hypothetical protein n=1 Tax=Xaviernesmea rhizosphaerae TaxID=1672749 RepID=UPI001FD89D75|nr:hypothetical protein [Xaviernesmea rhizosphaerae]
MRDTVAAMATEALASMATPAPVVTIPADSATAETAVKNLEPAFMSSSYLFPMSRGKLVPTPVMLPFYPLLSLKQGHPFISVYFTKTACPNGHSHVPLG